MESNELIERQIGQQSESHLPYDDIQNELNEFGRCVIKEESIGKRPSVNDTEESSDPTKMFSKSLQNIRQSSIKKDSFLSTGKSQKEDEDSHSDVFELASEYHDHDPPISNSDDNNSDHEHEEIFNTASSEHFAIFNQESERSIHEIEIEGRVQKAVESIPETSEEPLDPLIKLLEESDDPAPFQEDPKAQTDRKESVPNTFSLISKSKNVMDSPASRHLMNEFEKIVAKEIIKTKKEMEEVKEMTPSIITSSTKSMSIMSDMGSSKVGTKIEEEPPKILARGAIKCRYEYSGCKELLEKGSMHEQDHYQNCKYRPLECIFRPVCTELLPYHDYILHLNQHFLVPTYATEITCSVILTPDDFQKDQKWSPKWFSAYDTHFFANINRTANGVWSAWVWLLGAREEADNFAVRITFFKSLKCVSELFPVHSIRMDQEKIEAERTCLLVTDETMQELSLIGENFFADFSLKVELISHAQELNKTTRELRALSRSRPLKSEKLYVTTLDANEVS